MLYAVVKIRKNEYRTAYAQFITVPCRGRYRIRNGGRIVIVSYTQPIRQLMQLYDGAT